MSTPYTLTSISFLLSLSLLVFHVSEAGFELLITSLVLGFYVCIIKLSILLSSLEGKILNIYNAFPGTTLPSENANRLGDNVS